MNTTSKTSDAALNAGGAPKVEDRAKTRQRNREKTRDELHSAILRIKNRGKKISISAVAAEAGITPGLIHNTYPDIAESIRAEVGKGTRQQRDDKIAELAETRERMKELSAELKAALADIRRLASINETLRQEVSMLRSAETGTVVLLPPRKS